MSLAAGLLLASIVAWAIAEAVFAPREAHERLPREVATGFALLLIHTTAIVESLARGHEIERGAMLAGLTLIAAGVVLRIAAIRTLGPRFVSSATADRVISTGPYRWMRHPSEVGLLGAAAGAALVLESAVAATIAIAVLLPLCVLRCSAEDQQLAAARQR